jgi:hypothetical protein
MIPTRSPVCRNLFIEPATRTIMREKISRTIKRMEGKRENTGV